MSHQRYSGCEGLPDDNLERLRERFRQREETTARPRLGVGSAEQHAERRRLQRGETRTSPGSSGEYRDRC
jgi:hypothetical protein